MSHVPIPVVDAVRSVTRALAQGGLFRKYVAMFAAVLGVALLANGLVNIWFMLDENRSNLFRLQSEQATAAARRISQFVGRSRPSLAGPRICPGAFRRWTSRINRCPSSLRWSIDGTPQDRCVVQPSSVSISLTNCEIRRAVAVACSDCSRNRFDRFSSSMNQMLTRPLARSATPSTAANIATYFRNRPPCASARLTERTASTTGMGTWLITSSSSLRVPRAVSRDPCRDACGGMPPCRLRPALPDVLNIPYIAARTSPQRDAAPPRSRQHDAASGTGGNLPYRLPPRPCCRPATRSRRSHKTDRAASV